MSRNKQKIRECLANQNNSRINPDTISPKTYTNANRVPDRTIGKCTAESKDFSKSLQRKTTPRRASSSYGIQRYICCSTRYFLTSRETLTCLVKMRSFEPSSSTILLPLQFYLVLLVAGKPALPWSFPTILGAPSVRSLAALQAFRTSERSQIRRKTNIDFGIFPPSSSWTKSTASTKSSRTSSSPPSNPASSSSSAPPPKTLPFPSTKSKNRDFFHSQALISRCRVIELQPLSRSDLIHILTRAITDDIYIQKSGVEPRECIETRRFFLAKYWK